MKLFLAKPYQHHLLKFNYPSSDKYHSKLKINQKKKLFVNVCLDMHSTIFYFIYIWFLITIHDSNVPFRFYLFPDCCCDRVLTAFAINYSIL